MNKAKKFLFTARTCLIATLGIFGFSSCFFASFFAPKTSDDGVLKYARYYDHSSYSVVGLCDDSLEEVVIPATHEGLPVKYIDSLAFYNAKNLKSLVIGDNITYLDHTFSFYQCTQLERVVIGNGLKTLPNTLFRDCKNLTSVTLGKKISYIEDEAFYNCDNLTDVYITDLKAWCNIDFERAWSNPLYYANIYI